MLCYLIFLFATGEFIFGFSVKFECTMACFELSVSHLALYIPEA